MDGIGKFFQRLRWSVDARASAVAYRRVVRPAEAAILPLARPVLQRYILRGNNDAGALSLAYFGRFRRSVIPFEKCLFSELPTLERLPGIPRWRLRHAIEAVDCELVMVEAGHRAVHNLPRRRALTLPALVDSTLDLRGTWEEVQGRFRKTAKKRLRAVRKRDYAYRITEETEAFERFYRDMYLPTMKARHGDLSLPLSRNEAETYFRRGFLFTLLRGGREVCAGLCHPRGRTLRLLCFGVADGDGELIRQDVLGALQILRIEWAHGRGYEALDFLSSGPLPASGVFRYKRQWGTRVVRRGRPDLRLWLWLRRPTPAALRCFAQNPLIVVGDSGDLHGAVFLPDPDAIDDRHRRRLRHAYLTPGLESLLACPLASLGGNGDPLDDAIAL